MRTLRILLLVTSPLVLPGCLALAAGAAAGYGAVQYAENESSRTYPTTLATAWGACVDGLSDVGVACGAAPQLGATAGRFKAGDYQVRVEKLSESTVRVRVRVGTFDTADHRRRASLYLDAVSRRLGTT